MNNIPKYMKIYNYYKNEIEKGNLKSGDFLPVETSVCEQFGVSHMTYTKAMNELSSKGYIKRIPKKGTVVCSAYKTHIEQNIYDKNGITSQILSAGMTPRTVLYKYEILKGKDLPDIAEKLGLLENDYMHFIVRLRYADNNLLCISYTYISQMILPMIDISKLEGSLNKYIKEIGIKRSYGKAEFSACMPTPNQAKIIGNNQTPLLKQTIFWRVDDKPFELTYHYFVGEQYTITRDLGIIYTPNINNNIE